MRNRKKEHWEKLFATYKRKRATFEEKGKLLEGELGFYSFIALYANMEQTYRKRGMKSPTKNIIQNMVIGQISYDATFKEAKGIQTYLRKNYETLETKTFIDTRTGQLVEAKDVTIHDLRHATEIFGSNVTKDLIKQYVEYMKTEHPDWFTEGNTWKAHDKVSEVFFNGNSLYGSRFHHRG